MSRLLLHVQDLHAGYGATPVLFGAFLAVHEGEVVTLMGRNGMGKTTLVRAVMGLVPAVEGLRRFAGRPLAGLPAHRVAAAGIGLVSEGRQVFPNLTVRENLVATMANRHALAAPWTIDRVLDLFPRLADRLGHMGGQLSGGEQQMLAIGRALMTNPRLLILDEATEGLAPLIREEIWGCLAGLKAAGQAILLIDKHVERLLRLADRHYIIEKGRIVWFGDAAAMAAEPDLRDRYLGV